MRGLRCILLKSIFERKCFPCFYAKQLHYHTKWGNLKSNLQSNYVKSFRNSIHTPYTNNVQKTEHFYEILYFILLKNQICSDCSKKCVKYSSDISFVHISVLLSQIQFNYLVVFIFWIFFTKNKKKIKLMPWIKIK